MKTTDYFDTMPFHSTRYTQTAGGRLYVLTSDTDSIRHLGERIVWTLPHMCFGDYTGSAVEESNVRYVRENFGPLFDAGLLSERTEMYNAEMVLIVETDVPDDLSDLFRDFVDTISGLESYPVVDEDLWSEVEMDRQSEALDNYILQDFINAVASWDRLPNVNELLESATETGETLDLFHTAMERANEYWIDEPGGMWIDVEKLAEHVTAADINAIRATT